MHFMIACKLSSLITIIFGGRVRHIGREAAWYEGVRGGYGYSERNPDGDRVLDFAVANDFVIGNSSQPAITFSKLTIETLE